VLIGLISGGGRFCIEVCLLGSAPFYKPRATYVFGSFTMPCQTPTQHRSTISNSAPSDRSWRQSATAERLLNGDTDHTNTLHQFAILAH